MAEAHSFFFAMPKWAGFVLLIGLWIVFRSFLLRRQKRVIERMRGGRSMPPPPVPHGQIRCPRCAAGVPQVASFCPHCGLALNNLSPPIPQGPLAQRKARSGLETFIWIALGVIGLAAYVFWRWGGDEAMPPPQPERPHVRIHEHHHH
jgi:hypothetical protein